MFAISPSDELDEYTKKIKKLEAEISRIKSEGLFLCALPFLLFYDVLVFAAVDFNCVSCISGSFRRIEQFLHENKESEGRDLLDENRTMSKGARAGGSQA